jgi:ATP-dependent helicase/nuclease subunit A
MTEPIGGIHYDDAASLKYGELYEELIHTHENEPDSDLSHAMNRISKDVELILVTDEEPSENEDGLSDSKEKNSINDADNLKEDISGLYNEDDEIE